MTDHIGELDKIDEGLMNYDLSDEALEAAARVDGGRRPVPHCPISMTSYRLGSAIDAANWRGTLLTIKFRTLFSRWHKSLKPRPMQSRIWVAEPPSL
jgi:hypothetical protein